MTFRVEKADYDLENGFLYYVIFKPNLEVAVDAVVNSEELEAAAVVTETGELAMVSFVLPKPLRTKQALSFVCADAQTRYESPCISFDFVGRRGDTAVRLPARLELDAGGRIVGMLLQWQPSD